MRVDRVTPFAHTLNVSKGGGGKDQDGSRAGSPPLPRSAAVLNPKQARFVAEYLVDLNATQACIRAGYSKKTAHSAGPRLLGHVGVAEAIRRGQQRQLDKAIATRAERQKFWTEVMSGDHQEMRDRLKASELLGKSEADFTENHRHQGDLAITVVSDVKPTEFDR